MDEYKSAQWYADEAKRHADNAVKWARWSVRFATVGVVLALVAVIMTAVEARGEHGASPGCVTFSEYQDTFRHESMQHFTYRVGPSPQYEVWAQNSHIRYYRSCEDQTRADVHVAVVRRDNYLNGVWRVDNIAWTEARNLRGAPTVGTAMQQDSHGVLVSTDMPKCSDNLGRPCVNYNPNALNNESGFLGAAHQAKWVDDSGEDHFFWKNEPVDSSHPNRHWLDEYGDSIIDALKKSYPNVSKNWHRAWFLLVPNEPAYVQFPDGSVYLM